MNYARFEDLDGDLPDMDIDMNAVEFNEVHLFRLYTLTYWINYSMHYTVTSVWFWH